MYCSFDVLQSVEEVVGR